MTKMKPLTLLPPLIFAAALLAACGQKGPLFLPGKPPGAQTQGVGTSAGATTQPAADAAVEEAAQEEEEGAAKEASTD